LGGRNSESSKQEEGELRGMVGYTSRFLGVSDLLTLEKRKRGV